MSGISEHGRVAARNVEELRKARRLTFRDLSARLTDLGRPILPAVLHRLVREERRIDVDDLFALADVLEVKPADLLLPRHQAEAIIPPDDRYVLTALQVLGNELNAAIQGGIVHERADLLNRRLERLAFEVRTLLTLHAKPGMPRAENTKEIA